MTITEFLTARYDEADAVAQTSLRRFEYGGRFPDLSLRADGTVMANPGAILDDTAAKRAILQAWAARAEDDHPAISAHRTGLGLAIKLLAQPYADHHDYDESWTP